MEKIIELYEESHLPIKGWLQCCMLCGAKTSRVIEFKRVETKHMIYITNNDTPGLVGKIGHCLGSQDVNIANFASMSIPLI